MEFKDNTLLFKNSFLFFLFFLYSLTIYSQNIDKDSIVIQKIIDSEIIEKKGAKLITISDIKNVNLISSYIDKKNKEHKYKEEILIKEFNSKIGRRYLKGDKSTIPEIIAIINKKNKNNISDLFDELTLNYEEKEIGLILDEEIKQPIFKLIEDEKLEHLVIQFLGYNRVKDSQVLFENRFFSGNSTDDDRLFYWLASNFKSEKAVDYIYNLYFKDNTFLNDKTWVVKGFEEYFENGTLESKNKILEIGYDYLKTNPIKNNKIEKKSNDYLFSNVKLNIPFFGLLFKYGDDRNNEILSAIEKEFNNNENYSKIKKLMHFGKLKTLNELEKQELILDLLTDKETFFEVLETIKSDSYLYNNQTVLQKIVYKYQFFNFNDNYDLDRLISFFKGKDKKSVDKLIESEINDSELKKEILEKVEIQNLSFDEINKFLFENKIIDQLINQEQIDNYKKKEFASDDLNSIFTCLEIAKISINFDTEPNIIPVDYDVLLSSFMSISKNKINDVKSFVQYKWNDFEEKGIYQVLVYFNQKCYIMLPDDFGDWYDMESFQFLLNTIVESANIKETFNLIDTGDQTAFYIFGESKKIEILKERFQLENELNEEE
jgi:hypothetical protein